jgi:diguanylate cyclase
MLSWTNNFKVASHTKTKRFCMTLLLTFLVVIFVNNAVVNHASASALHPSNTTLVLKDGQKRYSFEEKLFYFIDTSNALSFSDFQANNKQYNFTISPKDNLSLGYIKSTVWLRFTVVNHDKNQSEWLLTFDYPLLDQIDIYESNSVKIAESLSSQAIKQWQHHQLGDSLAFEERNIQHRIFVTPVMIKQGQSKTFFVRVKTSSSMQLRPTLAAANNFFAEELEKEMFYGLIYGIMLLMAVYNLFLYLAVRDPSYLVYVFSVFSGGIFIMALNGHAYQYLWPNSPFLANKAIPLFTSLWMLGTALFTQMFLDTKKFSPKLHNALNVLLFFALFSVFFSFLGQYQLAIKIATGLALLNGVLILTASIICWRAGNRFARFFVAAWGVYALGTAMLILSRFGVLEDNFITHNSASLGLLVEIIMLSLALSDKYRVLTQDLKKQKLELEDKVALRTEELEKSNAQLEQLSRIDPLTGLANRRLFDDKLNQEWERLLRERKCLSILICDVDEFKSINDCFGHQYGDDCLKAISRVLEEALHRPADMVSRFGGDEFVVILPDTCKLGAELLGIKICELMENLAMEQAPDTHHSIVTLSIGCATLTPDNGNSIKELFALADRNLFMAKEEGRNCVVSYE